MSSFARSVFTIDVPRSAGSSLEAWSIFSAAEKLRDMTAAFLSIFLSQSICTIYPVGAVTPVSPTLLAAWAVGFALLFVHLLNRNKVYAPSATLLDVRPTERILRVTANTCLISGCCAYVFNLQISLELLTATAILTPLFVLFGRWSSLPLLAKLLRNYPRKRAVIVGTGNVARHVFTALVRSLRLGVEPVAFVDQRGTSPLATISAWGYHHEHSIPVLSGPVCERVLRHLRAEVLVVADPAIGHDATESLMNAAAEVGASAWIVPRNFLSSNEAMEYIDLDGIQVAQLSQPKPRPVYELGKRVLDVVGAALLILFFAFTIAPLIAIAVKLSSPGPLLFQQERIGKLGRPFTMYKFRSMYLEASRYDYSPTEGEDPRITRVGRFLRRTSLDELPQLLNVLLGDMSLVGPRPEMRFIVEGYSPEQRQRMNVKPGITCLWQISADRKSPIHENLGYDLYYVRHRSLWMDVAILLHTLLRFAHGV